MVSFDAAEPGTPEVDWAADERLHTRPALELAGVEELLVVAAHPDDETLGAGGLMAHCAALGMAVRVVVVTDGAASHPGDPRIVERRAAELEAAVRELAPHATIESLGFPDGGTREHRPALVAALRSVLSTASATAVVAAPWRGDGHRDHRVVGEVVAELVDGRMLLEYPFWMWHWAHPDHPQVPWDAMVSLDIDVAAKNTAISHHRSQVEGDRPTLTGDSLQHARRSRELFVLTEQALGRDYFEAVYARSSDPWRFRTRWYEERKRRVTVASLPRERYERGLEIGCSIGTLSDLLADRCEQLVAVDLSERAVAQARDLLGSRATVLHQDALEDFPEGEFDLVVLSEVGYYWGTHQLGTLLDAVDRSLAPGGTVVACHWRHPVEDYPLRGDQVHEVIARRGWFRLVSHREDDFVLEVFSDEPDSVARREGLA